MTTARCRVASKFDRVGRRRNESLMKVLRLRRVQLLLLLLILSTSGAIANVQTNQSPELAESRELNSKVIKLYGEAKYDEALPLAKRALELREKALGPAHEELIPLLTNLGELQKAKKQLGQARFYFERALTIAEKSFVENDIRTAHLLDKLGFVAYEQKQEKDAEHFFLQALQVTEKALS